MDPNAALAALRAMVEEAKEGGSVNPRDTAEEFHEQFTALDEWLSKGGFLPDAWYTEHDAMQCGCGQPIVWIEDDDERATGHWEHNVAEAYWGGDHSIDEPAPEGWTLS